MDEVRRQMLAGMAGAGGAALALAGTVGAAAAQQPAAVNADAAAAAAGVSVRQFGALGNGRTDDTAALNRAISSLKDGGCLVFPPGTYMVTRTLVPLPRGAAVYCPPGAWLKRAPTAANVIFFTATGNNDLVVNIDGNDMIDGKWVAESFGVYSNIASPADKVTVSRSRFRNLKFGIRADGATNWQVTSCTFENIKQCGVLAGSNVGKPVKYTTYSGNLFHRMGDYAIAFYPQVEDDCQIAFNSVIGNIAKDTQLGTSGHAFGIETGSAKTRQHDNAFIGNVVEQTIDSGHVQGGIVLGDTCRNSVISGNVLRGHGGTYAQGINLRSADTVQISANSITGFSGPGISLEGSSRIIVSANVIESCGGGRTQDNAAITIAINRGADAIDISGNLIDCAGPRGPVRAAITGYGTARRASTDWLIRANTIRNCSGAGIYLDGNGRLDSARVLDNTIACDPRAVTAGLHLARTTRSTVSRNHMRDAARGLTLAQCSGVNVDANAICDERNPSRLESSIELLDSTDVLITDNDLRGALKAAISPETALGPARKNTARGNRGFVTEASGATEPIASGAAIAHGLSLAPRSVVLSPADGPSTSAHVASVTARTFTIHFTGGGTRRFYWRAE